MEAYIPYYIHQFGRVRFKGAGFLVHILGCYMTDAQPKDKTDYKLLLSKAAEETGVTPGTMRRAIKRYVEDGWKQGFSWEWEKYTGWSADTPPDADTAIQLLCESVCDFIENYAPLIQENSAFYLRSAIENREKNQEKVLSSEAEITVRSELFMTLGDKKQLDAYVCYLTYRVQRDLYELCIASGQLGELSWRKFVWDMRGQKRVREAATIVAKETVRDFRENGNFNFDAKDVVLLRNSDLPDPDRSDIYSARLFEIEEGRTAVESLLLMAEVAQYRRQLASGKSYSWEHFLAELAQGRSLWDETIMAFRDALMNLDFKTLWQSKRLEELMKDKLS